MLNERWIFAILVAAIGVMIILIGAVWFNLNSQITDLHSEMRIQFTETHGERKVMMEQNLESSKNVTALTQRIQDLVERLSDVPGRRRR
jgi:hypothetical protein